MTGFKLPTSRAAGRWIAALCLCMAFVMPPVRAMTSVPYTGVLASHSGKCLAVEAASTLTGARVLQSGCLHAGNDQWQVQPNGSYYQLINRKSALCLAITGAALTAGAQLVQTTCATADSQLLSITAQGLGYAIRFKSSGLCVDISGASQADAATAIQWTCSGSTNQTFVFEQRIFVAQAALDLMSGQTGQCAHVNGNVSTAGAAIVQLPCAGIGSDTWSLKPIGQAVNIVGRQSGLCLDVNGASKAAGAAVIQWTCSGALNQQWKLQAFNNVWRLVASHSGLCLTVGTSGTAGAALTQTPCVGGTGELWSLHVPTLVAKWTGVIATTVDPVAAANLPSGKIVAWSADQLLNFNSNATGQTYTEVLDPVGGTQSIYFVTNTGHNMFCPGTAVLDDGRVLVNGGIDSTRTSLYDPVANSWSAGGNMNIGRGYEGTVMNADGTVLTLGGSWSGPGTGVRTGELWTKSDVWTLLPGVPSTPVLTADAQGVYRADNHLWLHVMSGGRLLQAGPSKQMNWISATADGGQGSIVSAGLRGDDADSMNGNASPYDVDMLLKVGGSPSYGYGTTGFYATTSALVINASAATATVTRIAPMAYARAFGNSVVLPGGQVVVVGGQTFAIPFSDDNSIYVPEIWNPASQVFERLPAMATPRNYHSVALLLPDGRVWVGGGGLCGSCTTNHANYEILTPPYLLNDDGTAAARPTITAVSSATPVLGSTLQVTTGTPVTSFALMRLSSVTHTTNNDQRRIPMTATTTNGALYTMTLSADPGVLVPGYYMLFALNARGVPSLAYTLRVVAS